MIFQKILMMVILMLQKIKDNFFLIILLIPIFLSEPLLVYLFPEINASYSRNSNIKSTYLSVAWTILCFIGWVIYKIITKRKKNNIE